MARSARLPLAIAVTTLLGTGCGGHPNVLLIVVDTLRADHLGAYGYPLDTSPNLDRFAAENLKFDYAISAAPWTSPSVASIFTAFYPTAHGVTEHVHENWIPSDAISGDFVTLAEVLQRAGYATRAVSANTWVSKRRGYAQGFDVFESLPLARAPVLTSRAFQHLAELREKQPFFLYLHYMDPHTPLAPPHHLKRRFRRLQQDLPAELVPGDEESRDRMAAYDGEIAVFDASLGQLLQQLRDLGLYEDMVVAVTSDHGYPFKEHGVARHGMKLHNEDTHVPLLLKLGGRRGNVEATVSTIDLYPTLVAGIGLEAPPGLQGVSLLDGLEERAARGAFAENTTSPRNHRSMVTEADEERVVGLFRSREDYGEREPIDDAEAVAGLRRRLWETYRESLAIHRGVTPARVELPPETIEQLRQLGYVE